MKRILVNATQQEELRVAIVDGQKLYDLDIEAAAKRQKKGNIYKGVISSITPSLNAVFVDYGGARQGFLPTKEICRQYLTADFKGPIRNQAIHKLVNEGQELIVQITREERSNKGASLSTYISLTGQYMVLLPNKPRVHGISQRISGIDRQRMLDLNRQLSINKGEGVILRTASSNARKDDLQKNLDYLRYLWKQIQKVFNERPAPFLIYKEANIVLQTIQNNISSDIGEIVIDNQDIYEEAKEFISMVAPRYKKKLKLYDRPIPLFNRMQIEAQIESLYQHKVDLPSGGCIVVDHTEALTSIDINSARSTQQQDLEKTALATNLEAADEIARQLRLRDLGGLLVIDFIDMLSRENKNKVEIHLQELLKKDRARTRLGSISKFGLLEMSRQRLRPSLIDASEVLCPRCSGRGFIRTVKSCALVVLRLIEEEAAKAKTAQVVGQVPTEVNKFLINEKRTELDEIEQRYKIKVSIVSDSQMETPHYKIMRYRENNGSGNNENHESVIVRPSVHEQSILAKQSSNDSIIKDEAPAIPTVITMEKVTLSERVKNLWQKLFALFSYQKTRNKRAKTKLTYKTYNKRKKTSLRRTKDSHKNRRRHEKKQALKSDTRRSYDKKPTQTYNDSGFMKRDEKQRSFNRSTDYNPPINSIHSNRKRRQYRNSTLPRQQYQSDSSLENNRTADRSVEQTTQIVSQATEKETSLNDVIAQPQTNNGKSKLIQVETKIKTDNHSR